MINKKTLLSIGSGLTVLTGLIAFTTAPSFAQKKPAIEVVTHAGAGNIEIQSKRILVIGGFGYLGFNIYSFLKENNYDVSIGIRSNQIPKNNLDSIYSGKEFYLIYNFRKR